MNDFVSMYDFVCMCLCSIRAFSGNINSHYGLVVTFQKSLYNSSAAAPRPGQSSLGSMELPCSHSSAAVQLIH